MLLSWHNFVLLFFVIVTIEGNLHLEQLFRKKNGIKGEILFFDSRQQKFTLQVVSKPFHFNILGFTTCGFNTISSPNYGDNIDLYNFIHSCMSFVKPLTKVNFRMKMDASHTCHLFFGIPDNVTILEFSSPIETTEIPLGYEFMTVPSWASEVKRDMTNHTEYVVALREAALDGAEFTILHKNADYYPSLSFNEGICRDYRIVLEFYDNPDCYIELIRTALSAEFNTASANLTITGSPTIYFKDNDLFVTAEESLEPLKISFCPRISQNITKLKIVEAEVTIMRFCRDVYLHIREDVKFIKPITTTTTTTTSTEFRTTTTTTSTEETAEANTKTTIGWGIACIIVALILASSIILGVCIYRQKWRKQGKRVSIDPNLDPVSMDSLRGPAPPSTVTAKGDSISEKLQITPDGTPGQTSATAVNPPQLSLATAVPESTKPEVQSKEKGSKTKIPSAEPQPKSKPRLSMDPEKDAQIPTSLMSKDDPPTVQLFEKAEEKQPLADNELLDLKLKLKTKQKTVRRGHKLRTKAEETAKQTAWEAHFETDPWKNDEKTIDKAVIYQVDYVNQILPISCDDTLKLADSTNHRVFCVIKHLFDGRGKRYYRLGTRFKCSFGDDGVPEYSVPPQLLKIFVHDVIPPAFEIHFRNRIPKFIIELIECPLCTMSTNTTITMSDYPLFRSSELGDFSGYIRNMPPGSHTIGFISPSEDIREASKCIGIFVYRGRDRSSAKKMRSALCVHKNIKELDPVDISFVEGQLDNLVSAVVDTTNEPIAKNNGDDAAFWEEQRQLGAKSKNKKGPVTELKSANQTSPNKDTTKNATKASKKSNLKTAPTQED